MITENRLFVTSVGVSLISILALATSATTLAEVPKSSAAVPDALYVYNKAPVIIGGSETPSCVNVIVVVGSISTSPEIV